MVNDMRKKVLIMVVILFIIMELFGIYLAIKYRDFFVGGIGYEAVIRDIDGNHVIADCVTGENVCKSNGDLTSISLVIPDNENLKVGDKIGFKYNTKSDNTYEFYYTASKSKIDFITNLSSFLTGAPFGSLIIFAIFYFMYKSQTIIYYKYLPYISAFMFFFGYLFTCITENDLIQGIGILLIIGSLILPLLLKNKYKNINNNIS